jgi:hypothetical protein
MAPTAEELEAKAGEVEEAAEVEVEVEGGSKVRLPAETPRPSRPDQA